MISVLLDTSFCIRLLKEDDPLHSNAVDYYEYFLEEGVVMYLSTVVIAEYSVVDDPANLPLQTMRILPFDFGDARTAGEFHAVLLNNRQLVQGEPKPAIKDDCKLLAQAHVRGIEAFITKDRKSFRKFIAPLAAAKGLRLQEIDLSIPLTQFRGILF